MSFLAIEFVGYIVIMGFDEFFVCNEILDSSTFIALKLRSEALCIRFFLNFEVVLKLFIFGLSINSFLCELFTLFTER